jgi:hypothetical protein
VQEQKFVLNKSMTVWEYMSMFVPHLNHYAPIGKDQHHILTWILPKLWGNMIGRRFPEYCSFMSSQEILCFKRLSSLGVLQLCELADFCRCLSTYVLAVLGGTVDQLLNHLQREVRFL